MSILDYIYNFVYEFFLVPIYNFVDNFFDFSGPTTPITLTMPGSNVVLLTTTFHDLILFGVSIFLLIASIGFFWGVIKMLYKVGRSLFGGKR